MPDSISPGTPCGLKLTTPHLRETVAFYRRLFGWSVQDRPGQVGGRQLTLDDEPVGEIDPSADDDERSYWTPYFATDDPAATAAAVVRAGGTVVIEPTDTLDAPAMTVCAAPDGAVFGAARPFGGGVLTGWGRPGRIGSIRLLAERAEAADFYRQLFGWRFDPSPGGFTVATADSTTTFGTMHVMDPVHRPPNARPSWCPVFTVADTDAVAAHARDAGATVPMGPVNVTDTLRTAFIVDPYGAGFSVAS